MTHGDALHTIETNRRRLGSLRDLQQPRNRGAIQVGVEHTDAATGAGQASRQVCRDVALSHAAFSAHHRHNPPDHGQAFSDPLALGADLVGETGAVGIGQLVVRAHG